MTLRFMIDTDVASYIVKERPPAFREAMRRIPFGELCVSAITQAELAYGLTALDDGHATRAATDALLRSVTVLDWPAGASTRFAQVKRHLVVTGQIIGEMDLLIAAHALYRELALVTNNHRHFSRVPGLTVIDWREPAVG